MKQSLKAFMKEIIDYAGLFPPASLQMDPAIHNFARYRSEEDAWILSRFIIPASRLEELKAYEELFVEGDPFEFSVLGRGTETATEFKKEIDFIIQSCSQFHEQYGDHVKTDVLEIKLPEEAVQANDIPMLEELLLNTARSVDNSNSDRLPRYIFYEAVLNESWEKDLETVLKAVSNHNKSGPGESGTYQYAGFKLRCGGVEASLFPSPEQVAYTLNKARKYEVPVKCTAGLHHPVRHYDDSVQTKMHGFFNVFGGAMLAHVHDLTNEEFTEILREEDPEQFSFSDETLSWNDLSVSTSDIQRLRETALISYGSCSFDEPREDLQKLKLL